ncbi:T9SS type A sorting domain-containing protein, partial [bacterium]|nr:T9SS type A sorting domain-containing protein [bacterium]
RIGGGQKASAQLDVDAGALSDPNYAIFAHNNGGLTPNTDNKPDVIDRRWNRVWTFDMYGTVTATFTFTVPPGQITNKESMVLLESNSDTDFSGATSVGTRVTGVPNTTMQFTNVSIADGKSYTIGSITSDNPLPVQLSVFTATDTMDGVLISWRTESELDNLGFNIYRSDTEDGKYTRVNARMIQGAGTDANSHDYSFTDDNVVFGKTYFYYLENIDIDGSKSKSEIIKVVTPEFLEPKEFRLMQNYPNPFNPDTWFPYELPTDTTVIIRIYDVNGHLVRHLDLGKQKAGSYIYKEKAAYWDGTDQTGKSVSSGLYFYTLEAGDFRATKRMVILK